MDTRRPPIPLERMSLDAMLACVSPFTGASREEVELLGRTATRVRKPAGQQVLREGTTSDGIYVVLRGRVNLVREGAGGRDLILSSLGPGAVFGEGCAIEGMMMSTSAVCAVATELVRVPAEAVRDHVRRDPTTVFQILRLINDKLGEAEAIASGLALCDVEERLRRTLARLARRQGRPSPGETGWILAPVPTQSELARMVGSCRETVSRTLSAMARDGQISANGRRMLLTESLMSAC
jgi:CRP-like cAMP-binding protein